MLRLPALLSIALVLPLPVPGQSPRPTLEIHADVTEVRLGDPIPITFVITNRGTAPYDYNDRNYDRSGRMPEYRLQAFDRSGAALADPRTTAAIPRGYIGGGLGAISSLPPGHQFTKTIDLNLWAVMASPGVYTVRGTYPVSGAARLESSPLTLRVLPRTAQEMGQYVEQLANQLTRTADAAERVELIKRLMFTRDPRAVTPLRELKYPDNNARFWISEAFAYYLPGDTGR
jgi:hypothetical protein